MVEHFLIHFLLFSYALSSFSRSMTNVQTSKRRKGLFMFINSFLTTDITKLRQTAV